MCGYVCTSVLVYCACVYTTCTLCTVQIRDDTGARIDLPTEKSESDVIVIVGKKENAEKAKAMILAVEKQLVSFCAFWSLCKCM